MEPRYDRMNWDDHHMMIAILTAQRSPDPNTQVGACIVDHNNRVIGTGYNSFPRDIDPKTFSWSRSDEDPLQTKYPFVVHAERNACHNRVRSLEGAHCYVTLFPCNVCMQALIQEGVTRIIFLEDKYPDNWETKAAKRLAAEAHVGCYKHVWAPNSLESIKVLLDKFK